MMNGQVFFVDSKAIRQYLQLWFNSLVKENSCNLKSHVENPCNSALHGCFRAKHAECSVQKCHGGNEFCHFAMGSSCKLKSMSTLGLPCVDEVYRNLASAEKERSVPTRAQAKE